MATIGHVGLFFRKGNAGDIVMRAAVKEHLGPEHQYVELNVRTEVGADEIEQLNACDAVVVGGGGLFWQNPRLDHPSGWQWHVSDHALRAIEAPITLYSVGDSTFTGDVLDTPQFRSSMAVLLGKSARFGFRNAGSYRTVRAILGPALERQAFFQPCPTTFLDDYWPHRADSAPRPSTGPAPIAVNLPLDRAERRYPSGAMEHVAASIAELATHRPVEIVAHVDGDQDFADLVSDAGTACPVVRLHGRSADEIVAYYRTVAASVSGRGHGLMIPFGLGIPAFGLHSHPKTAWFAETTAGTVPGLWVNRPDLRHALAPALDRFFSRLDRQREPIKRRSDDFLGYSLRNRHALGLDAERPGWPGRVARSLRWRTPTPLAEAERPA